jgi:hypothetical protein
MKKLASLLLCVLLFSGCSKKIELQKQTFTIELGQDVYGNPALYIKNAEEYNTDSMAVVCLDNSVTKLNNRFISMNQDYLVCGQYDFEVIAGNQRVAFKIKIKDTQPPNVANNVESITVKQNETINWDNVFGATDLSGVSYEAPNGITEAKGSRDVVVKISDRYGNSVEKSVIVYVE